MTPLKKRCEVDIVLNLLSKGFNKKEVRQKLNIKPTALSNHLRRLENSGYIAREGKYIIKVLQSSYSHLRVTKNQVHNRLNKRGHAFNFKVIFLKEENLITKPKVQYELKTKSLKKLKFGSLKLIKNKNSIWINKGSLTIYSNNSYYSGNALHSKFRALKEIDNLVVYLKDRFGFSGIYGIEIFREHYGLIFNKFAKWILKKGQKLYVKNRGNKTTLWVDSSRKDDQGLEEFEGGDPIEINNADAYFKSHEKMDWKETPERVRKDLNENKGKIDDHNKVINKSMKVLEGYSKQITLHLKVEQAQEKHLEDQTQLFREIRDHLKNGKK